MYAIFDIDNCISDDNWRQAFIKKGAFNPDDPEEKWHEYHTYNKIDSAHNRHVVRAHADNGEDILYVTSRPVKWLFETSAWLRENGFPEGTILMRPRCNYMTSPELKPYLLRRCRIEPSEVVVAYDDRDDVLDAYDNLGIKAIKMSLHPQVDA